jgi:hypothetical protein
MSGIVALIMIGFSLVLVLFGNTATFTLNGIGQCLVFGLLFGGFAILIPHIRR